MAPWTQWLFQSTESLFRSFEGRTSSSTRPQTMAERQRSPACSMKSMNEAGLFFQLDGVLCVLRCIEIEPLKIVYHIIPFPYCIAEDSILLLVLNRGFIYHYLSLSCCMPVCCCFLEWRRLTSFDHVQKLQHSVVPMVAIAPHTYILRGILPVTHDYTCSPAVYRSPGQGVVSILQIQVASDPSVPSNSWAPFNIF